MPRANSRDVKPAIAAPSLLDLVAAPSAAPLVQAIRELGAKLDTIKISFEVENSAILVNRLIALESDFVVARMPDTVDPRNFNYDDLDEEEACFVARVGHPLADGVVSLRDLVDLQWVLEPRGPLSAGASSGSFARAESLHRAA
jgi:DNA-binding transcriptional LysR family regulator